MLEVSTIERMSALGASRQIVVALSGGGDSTALLHLLAERVGAERLVAGIVDHGLRRGSADDAARAADMAHALGVRAHITTLSWEEGANGSQHAARHRRYAALAALANSVGARVIATGHNRDDQAETVVMRAARWAAWYNLVCMRAMTPLPLWPQGRGLWLARPLLGVRRAALRDDLLRRGASWIEDPANASIHYERVLTRQRLAEREAAGFDPMRLAGIAERLAPLAARVGEEAAALIKRAVRLEYGTASFKLADWSARGIAYERALQLLIAAAGGSAHAPHPSRVRIMNALMLSHRRPFKAQTLGGAVVRRHGDVIRISRDRGALYGRADGARGLPALALDAGIETVWDGRLALKIDEPGWTVVLGRNGQPELENGAVRKPIAAAAPRWLLEERVQHLLGQD